MNDVLKGMLLAGFTIAIGICLPEEQMYQFFAILLGFAAGVYIGFTVADPVKKEYYLQWAVSLAFIGLAVAGIWFSPLILGVAWLLHGLWDLLHHFRIMKTRIAGWYGALCLIYDITVGSFIICWAAV